MSVLETLSLPSAAWAMGGDDIAGLLGRLSPAALLNAVPRKAARGERLANENGVGILFVRGPMFKRESLITQIFGFTTYEMLRRDLQAALDDKTIEAIALNIDSPGGEASGCDELANAIFEARKKKPIRAHVSGMACSAGYWIASAAEKVIVSDAAIVGSIGVALAMTPRNDPKEIEFVSSKAPNKRPDITSNAGRSRVQKMVDDLGDVFIAHVARNRGVSTETVAAKFGQGGVEIGAKAVKAGMADGVGQWPATLKALRSSVLSHRANPRNLALSTPSVPALAVAAPIPAAPVRLSPGEVAKAKAEAARTARIAAICRSDEAKDLEETALQLAMETETPVDVALATLRTKKAEMTRESWKKTTDSIGWLPGSVKSGEAA